MPRLLPLPLPLLLLLPLACSPEPPTPSPRLYVAEQLASYRPDFPLPTFATLDDLTATMGSAEYQGDRINWVQHATSFQATQAGDCEDWAFYFVATAIRSGLLAPNDVVLAEAYWATPTGRDGHMAAVYRSEGSWWEVRDCAFCTPRRLDTLEGFAASTGEAPLEAAFYTRVDRVDGQGTVLLGDVETVPLDEVTTPP